MKRPHLAVAPPQPKFECAVAACDADLARRFDDALAIVFMISGVQEFARRYEGVWILPIDPISLARPDDGSPMRVIRSIPDPCHFPREFQIAGHTHKFLLQSVLGEKLAT